jgi:hypothetical protein
LLGGDYGTKFNWKYGDDTPVCLTYPLCATYYTTSGINSDEFTFKDVVVFKEIYCTITNTGTHHDLEIETIKFELSYKYNTNDVEKLKTFLEKPSEDAKVKNGAAINPVLYDTTDPRTFNVT